MSNSYFQFKQFIVQQNASAMKVNTDGVLLGAWIEVQHAKYVAEAGTGTGIIALMLAQRNPSLLIDAVEIDAASAKQATENVAQSIWHERISVVCGDFRQFSLQHAGTYDAVVSNPPYFVDSLLSPEAARTIARHTESLSHEALIGSARQALKPTGKLHVILPYVEGTVFIAKAAAQGLYCVRKTNVRTASNKPVKRLLLSFSLVNAALHENTLCIHLPDSTEYTPEYQMLTRDFYLKF